MRTYKQFIQKKRIDLGLNIKGMAEKLGCSATWLSTIENERVKMPKNFGKKLKEVFDFTKDEIIELDSILEYTSDLTIELSNYKEEDRVLIYDLFKYFEHLTNSNKSKIRQMLDRIKNKTSSSLVEDDNVLEQQNNIEVQEDIEQKEIEKQIKTKNIPKYVPEYISEDVPVEVKNQDFLYVLDELYEKMPKEEIRLKEEEETNENENSIKSDDENIKEQEDLPENENFIGKLTNKNKYEDKNLQNLFKKINVINNDVNNDIVLNVK